MWFEATALVVSALAGALAAVTGFGIGSLLTPLLVLQMDTRLAVAAVSIPHVVGTAVRFYFLSGSVNRTVLWRFGLASAAGGLTGALLQGWAGSRWLTTVFGTLLWFAAISDMTGLAKRMRFSGHLAWTTGALSGLLGGLVGNQGGLRSAALLGFGLSKTGLVATATAIGLIVDGARMPVYLIDQYGELSRLWPVLLVATIGVTTGTLFGSRILTRIPDVWFHRVLAAVLATLGTMMLWRAAAGI